jgi:hypothetical protein
LRRASTSVSTTRSVAIGELGRTLQLGIEKGDIKALKVVRQFERKQP